MGDFLSGICKCPVFGAIIALVGLPLRPHHHRRHRGRRQVDHALGRRHLDHHPHRRLLPHQDLHGHLVAMTNARTPLLALGLTALSVARRGLACARAGGEPRSRASSGRRGDATAPGARFGLRRLGASSALSLARRAGRSVRRRARAHPISIRPAAPSRRPARSTTNVETPAPRAPASRPLGQIVPR